MNDTQSQNSVPTGELSEDRSSLADNTDPSEPGTALVVYNKEGNGNGGGLFSRILNIFGLKTNGSLREELTDALSSNSPHSELFSPEERAMLNNILRLREVRVEDVMIPRAEIIAVDQNISLAELLSLFESSNHSRMPVFDDTLDDPHGMVHIRDVMGYFTHKGRANRSKKKSANIDLAKVDLTKSIKELKLIRPVLYVPPSMLASDLMARMQARRIQMALVIDEYGGTDGLASLEDIVEEVVGEIEDEHDEDENNIEKTGDRTYVADARCELEDARKLIGDKFDYSDLDDDIDTIGGLVFALAGRIPVRGEVIHGANHFEFRVLDADPRRVKKVQIVSGKASGRRRTTSASE